jgi:copper transport protein
VARRLLLVAAAALAWAPGAFAHAIPVASSPANGSVLASAPREARVTFDSPVRVAPGNAAIRNDGTNVLAGVPRIAGSRAIVLPLRAHLGPGDYSVRWSIVSEDGHEQQGVIAFAIGAGSPPPTPALTVHGFETWQRVLMRTAFFLGALGSVGATFFSLVVLRAWELPRRQAHLLFVTLLLAFVGAEALSHTAGAAGTRFERVMIVAAVTAGVGGAAAALAPRVPRLRYLAWAASAVLFPCPTLAGHALDPDQPRLVAPIADLVHLGGAAIWIGGVAALAVTPVPGRADAARRFAGYAVPAVVLVAAGGLARALTELSSVSQLWTTAYGRVLLVKSALFLAALLAGWIARRRLESRALAAELVVLTILVVAVGTLTDVKPGRERAFIRPAAPRSHSRDTAVLLVPRARGSTAHPRTPQDPTARRAAAATASAAFALRRSFPPHRRDLRARRTEVGYDGSPAGSARS